MKTLLLFITLFCHNNLFSQTDKKIYLSTLNDSLVESIIKQGKCLFKKSNCIKSDINDYYIIPSFYVSSKIPLQKLKFSSRDSLFSNLYIIRKSTKKFLVNFGWDVINKENLHSASSDWKRFYCYDKNEYLFDYLESARNSLGLNNIKYVFAILGANGFIEFIVNKENQIFVYYSRDKKWMTLSEFSDFYQRGKIQKFDDNPFK